MIARRFRAFTLMELLIVVAILGILVAVAVPNFLEARVRSKVSRCRADLRALRTALEAYAVDEDTYPLNAGGIGFPGALVRLLRPRSYLTSLPNDPFRPDSGYSYVAPGSVLPQSSRYGEYLLAGAGPDQKVETTWSRISLYDPTNGTVSRGDIVASHKDPAPQ